MQSKRISLATGGSAIPGAVPDTMDALLDTQELAAQQAVQLAEKFATNVAPAVVPEAAGRARLADLQADIGQCRLTFLSTHTALVALANGRLLQLSLQVPCVLDPHASLLRGTDPRLPVPPVSPAWQQASGNVTGAGGL